MNKKFARLSLTVAVTLSLALLFTGVALAAVSHVSPSAVEADTTTLYWSGQGSDADFALCGTGADPGAGGYQNGASANNYMLWIFATDGGSVATTPTLTINGTMYDHAYKPASGDNDYGYPGAWQIVTPYIDPSTITAAYKQDQTSTGSAFANFTVNTVGNGTWVLTISHGCAGPTEYEHLTVTKTVKTSFTRNYKWSIDKKVENGDGYPEIWLYIPGQGDFKPSTGIATWTVDVTYEGYDDSNYKVSGEITIENDGTLAAAITYVDDLIHGSNVDILFPADCGDFTGTLDAGATVTCTYSYPDYITGDNEAIVITERDRYSDTEPIVWGVPTTEVNKTVKVVDTSVDYVLGTLDAENYEEGGGHSFQYIRLFDWADYGQENCGEHTYVNTARVISGDKILDEASATLKVNVQCYIYDTTYAKGNEPTCFIPTFDQWGWTNYITPIYTGTWDLWAGAAMCNTSRGYLVGTVTVVYDGSSVTVTYNVDPYYTVFQEHVYAGSGMFPKMKVGKKWVDTVAPGQYYIEDSLSSDIYVIAHAKIGYPDPNFGP